MDKPCGQSRYLISKASGSLAAAVGAVAAALDMAVLQNRIFYVDWQDTSVGDFARFFTWVDLAYLSDADAIPTTCSVYPDIWQGGIHSSLAALAAICPDVLAIDPEASPRHERLVVHCVGNGQQVVPLRRLCAHWRPLPDVAAELAHFVQLGTSLVYVNGHVNEGWLDRYSRWQGDQDATSLLAAGEFACPDLLAGLPQVATNNRLGRELTALLAMLSARELIAVDDNDLLYGLAHTLRSSGLVQSWLAPLAEPVTITAAPCLWRGEKNRLHVDWRQPPLAA